MTREERSLDIFKLYVNEGWSLQRVGDKYGISRERVRQILAKDWANRPVMDLRNIVKDSARRVELRDTEKACPCCLQLHNRGVTMCSPRCTRLWSTTRYRRDEGYRNRHRLYAARSILRNQGRYSSARVQYAHRVAEGKTKRYEKPRYSRVPSEAHVAMLRIEGLRGVIN